MKKVFKQIINVIEKILTWFGAIFVAIFTVLFVSECQEKKSDDPVIIDDVEEINAKACKRRQETINRIHNADARTLTESYGTACDAIIEGKQRFRNRCNRADN